MRRSGRIFRRDILEVYREFGAGVAYLPEISQRHTLISYDADASNVAE